MYGPSVRLADTHEVANQPPPFADVNLLELDAALREGLEREGAGWALERVWECGAVAGSAEAQEHARRAERHAPVLRTHDRYGHRIDELELDPSWHWLLRRRARARDPLAALARPAARARTSPTPRSCCCGRRPTPASSAR